MCSVVDAHYRQAGPSSLTRLLMRPQCVWQEMQGSIISVHGWSERQGAKPNPRPPSRRRYERLLMFQRPHRCNHSTRPRRAHPIHDHSGLIPTALRPRLPSRRFAAFTVDDALVGSAPTSLSFTCCIRPAPFQHSLRLVLSRRFHSYAKASALMSAPHS